MTLAITQKTDNGILSLSDTKLTDLYHRMDNPYFGALKAQLIGVDRSLHFAGDTFWAEQALHAITENYGSPCKGSSQDVQDTLLEIHRRSSGATDFLLVDASDSSIARIRDSSCIGNCEGAYVGSPDAYRRYVAYREEAKATLRAAGLESSDLVFAAIHQAFDQVLAASDIPSVAGLPVGIRQQGEQLCYQQKIAVNAGPARLKVGREPRKVPFGSTAAGSHSVSFLSPEAGEWPQCLAAHLHFGNIGILWGPGHYMSPIVITNCTHDKLVNSAKKEYGVGIDGPRIG